MDQVRSAGSRGGGVRRGSMALHGRALPKA